mgnify:CR=1 FL=1
MAPCVTLSCSAAAEKLPVRLIRNKFFEDLRAAYQRCATVDELKEVLGRARAKKGMFEGDLVEGAHLHPPRMQ